MGALGRVARNEGPPPSRPSTWRIVFASVLALGGLGISIYLTIAHFVGSQILVCSGSGAINCAKVTTSPQSYVFGMPVAVLGLAYYVVMVAMNSPWAWRAADRRIHIARLALAVLGMGFVLYLISAELLIIKAICIWCTAVHIVTFAQLILVLATVPTMLGWGQYEEPAPASRPASQPRNGARKPTNGRSAQRSTAAPRR